MLFNFGLNFLLGVFAGRKSARRGNLDHIPAIIKRQSLDSRKMKGCYLSHHLHLLVLIKRQPLSTIHKFMKNKNLCILFNYFCPRYRFIILLISRDLSVFPLFARLKDESAMALSALLIVQLCAVVDCCC